MPLLVALLCLLPIGSSSFAKESRPHGVAHTRQGPARTHAASGAAATTAVRRLHCCWQSGQVRQVLPVPL
ncbi:hypothetical protein PR003_g5862 [Phytophthora rubi]|uniref:RxLR effector protein n=1 Tax=Phytophthora rubi TaxID=129364 RepID=A0A6A4FR83_9STRA|nr:hypothetical protein PR003_g5862 [Phytophthora rubi]